MIRCIPGREKSSRTARPPPANMPSSLLPTSGPDCLLSTLSLRQTIGPLSLTVNPRAVPLCIRCSSLVPRISLSSVVSSYATNPPNRTHHYPFLSRPLANLSAKFSLTFVIPLVQYSLENTLFGLREPCLPQFFSGRQFRLLQPQTTKIAPFKINHLRIAIL